MTKIVITKTKAEKLMDKVCEVKELANEVLACLDKCVEEDVYEDEDGWDDEYEVKARRGRRGLKEEMYKKMKHGGMVSSKARRDDMFDNDSRY